MNGRPPRKKELNQQEAKVMKVEGEKLVFYLAAHWKRRERSGVLGRGELIKTGVLRWILPGYLSRGPDWEYQAVWSSSGRSMRGGAMSSDITSPMKPSSLPSEVQRAIFRRLRWSRPRMACHLSLNGLWLDGIRTCVEDQT